MCNRDTSGNWETFIWQITTYPGKPLHQASVDGKQFSKVEMFEQEAIWLSPNPTHDVLNIQINELRQDATAPLFISVINTNSEVNVPLAYGDYYYVEALIRYKNYGKE